MAQQVWRRWRGILLAAGCAALAIIAPAGAKGPEIDLALVLAVDISGSMDAGEQRVQREGYVSAIRSSEVINAILGGLTGRIALTYVEWAGSDIQNVVVPWTLIDSREAAVGFSNRLSRSPLRVYRGTSISAALLLAADLFDALDYSPARRTIDISGDGPNNMGLPLAAARALTLGKGITINGLPIMIPGHAFGDGFGELDDYYRQCVIGGPASFLFTVTSLREFPIAIRRKLVQEIAFERPAPARVQAAQALPPICVDRTTFPPP